jgi:hypothetical protein
VNSYALLPCANPIVPSPFLNPSEPDYQEAGSLVAPFFFKDTTDPSTSNELTFFVQPSLTEKTIQEWVWWAVAPAGPAANWLAPSLIDQIHVLAQAPAAGPVPVAPGDPASSIYPVRDLTGWLTSSVTAVTFGTTAVGKNGRIVPRVASAGLAATPGPTRPTNRWTAGYPSPSISRSGTGASITGSFPTSTPTSPPTAPPSPAWRCR